MRIFGKTLSEYLRFQAPILVLIVVVGLARLALSLAGVPNSAAKWLSVTVAVLIGTVYYAVRAHTTGFGSYKQLLPPLWIQSVVANGIVIVGIVIGIATGRDNIFTAPEYSGGGEGKTWFHVIAHVVVGVVVFPLITWALASLIYFVTKKVAPRPGAGPSPAATV